MSPVIEGGHIIHGGNVTPGSEPVIYDVTGVPTDAKVGGGYWTPANGDLACNLTTKDIYERQTGVWTRIDTV